MGVNEEGNGEVFRLNLEVGRFMKGFEVDVGGDDLTSLGGGALQGGIRTGSVNCAAVAEESHGLLAFGTSQGTVEFWDSRSRNRVSALGPPMSKSILDTGQDIRSEITALEFHPSGLNLAAGDSNGLIHTYDLRSPVPVLRKDQGYGSRIQTLKYLTTSTRSSSAIAQDKLLAADRKCIKIFDSQNGNLWTSVEPAVDLNHVEWVPDSGMLLTANEGRQQHAFFIPQLGPAPRWCGFLDNLVEEMAEDADADPNAYNSGSKRGAGEVYDNFKFVDMTELRNLNLDHLITGKEGAEKYTGTVLRPYMHGYFVPQGLYEQARLLANPDLALQARQKSIQEKIDKERESRIRGNKKVAVKVNRKYAEKLAAREEANERRKAERIVRKKGEQAEAAQPEMEESDKEVVERPEKTVRIDTLSDDRFKNLFENEDFEIDETSREFQMHNPSTAIEATHGNGPLKKRGLTAVESEDIDLLSGSSEDGGDDDEAAEAVALQARQRRRNSNEPAEQGKGRIGSSSYKRSGHRSQREPRGEKAAGPRMQVSSSNNAALKQQRARQSRSFGDLASSLPSRERGEAGDRAGGGAVGAKAVTFAPAQKSAGRRQQQQRVLGDEGRQVGKKHGGRGWKERRSASNNVFRRM